MYGHMLLGFASFVKNTYVSGDQIWAKICRKAGVNPEQGFFTHEVYGDEIFFKLAEAAVDIIGSPMEVLLEQFGEYTFSVYWRKSRHDSLLDSLGYTMNELISNLDALHLHLSSTYTKMIAPSFSCEPLPRGLRVHYHSCRPGLVHYVKGILHSVAENIYRLDVDVEIEMCEEKTEVMLKNHSQLTITLKGDINEHTLTRLRGGSVVQKSSYMKRRKTLSSIPANFHVASITAPSRKRGGSITSPEESSVDIDTQWPITPELFCQTSPFHILFDDNLSILSMGESIAQLLLVEHVGEYKVGDYFSLEVPNAALSYKNIRLHSAGLFVIKINVGLLSSQGEKFVIPRFRGQMIPLSSMPKSPVLFLASPAVNSFQELAEMGLTSQHLALYDPLHELLKNNSYLASKVNLSDELERAKHHVEIEKAKVQREKKRVDDLLQAMLPAHVAAELKGNGYAAPQEFSQISILFTGLENFDAICKLRDPLQVVILLNRLFKRFDGLVEKHHVYKVETTGDSYMMAAGLPGTAKDHAQSVTDMAFDMREVIGKKDASNQVDFEADLELVIGIHSGPVVAGVIGTKLPRYCLFGDTVNTASRMNSTGEVGRIHISHITYENLKKNSKYCFVNRGKIHVKGLGLRTTYFVERYDPTQTEVKTLGQHTSVSQGNLLPTNTRNTSEHTHNHNKSTCAMTKNTQTGSTSLWSAPNFSTHLGPTICDNLPIAS